MSEKSRLSALLDAAALDAIEARVRDRNNAVRRIDVLSLIAHARRLEGDIARLNTCARCGADLIPDDRRQYCIDTCEPVEDDRRIPVLNTKCHDTSVV